MTHPTNHLLWVVEVATIRDLVTNTDVRREDTRLVRVVKAHDEHTYTVEYLSEHLKPTGLTRELDLKKHQIYTPTGSLN
jgi:hypothetical protein